MRGRLEARVQMFLILVLGSCYIFPFHIPLFLFLFLAFFHFLLLHILFMFLLWEITYYSSFFFGFSGCKFLVTFTFGSSLNLEGFSFFLHFVVFCLTCECPLICVIIFVTAPIVLFHVQISIYYQALTIYLKFIIVFRYINVYKI